MSTFLKYALSSLFSTLFFSFIFSYLIMRVASFYILGKDKKKYLLKTIFKNKNMLCLFLFIFFTFAPFFVTVVQRECVYAPLSNVLDGWSFYNSQTGKFDFLAIGNIFLITPSTVLLCIIFLDEKPIFKIILESSLFSFLYSLLIELNQLIFSKGTFQLSDIVYNTLGGLIGALIYLAVKLIINKIKEKGAK